MTEAVPNGGFAGLARRVVDRIFSEYGIIGVLLVMLFAVALGWAPSQLRTAIQQQTKILRAICYRLPEAKLPCEDLHEPQ